MIVVVVQNSRPLMLTLHLCGFAIGGINTPPPKIKKLIFEAIEASEQCKTTHKCGKYNYSMYLSGQRISTDATYIVCVLYGGAHAEYWAVPKQNNAIPIFLYSELAPKEFFFSLFFSEKRKRQRILDLINSRDDKRLLQRLVEVARSKLKLLLCCDKPANNIASPERAQLVHVLDTFITRHDSLLSEQS